MSKRLRKGEKCPIHGSYYCCGRSHTFKAKTSVQARVGVKRIDDEHHPRGYREICSPAEMRRRKHVLLAKDPTCWLCGLKFTDYDEVENEHVEPKGLGGATRDDHMSNLALAHRRCNTYKGSRRDIENVQKELRERKDGQ